MAIDPHDLSSQLSAYREKAALTDGEANEFGKLLSEAAAAAPDEPELESTAGYLSELQELYQEYTTPAIRSSLATALVEAIAVENESDTADIDLVEQHLQDLESLYQEAEDMKLFYARGLAGAIDADGSRAAASSATTRRQRLDGLCDPSEADEAYQLARGLSYEAKAHGKGLENNEGGEAGVELTARDRIQELYERHGTENIAEAYGRILYIVAVRFEIQERFDDQADILVDFEELYAEHPTETNAYNLSWCMAVTIDALGEHNKLDRMQQFVDRIEELYAEYPDKVAKSKIRCYKNLVTVWFTYHERFHSGATALSTLDSIYEKHDQGAESLADALVVATEAYAEAGKEMEANKTHRRLERLAKETGNGYIKDKFGDSVDGFTTHYVKQRDVEEAWKKYDSEIIRQNVRESDEQEDISMDAKDVFAVDIVGTYFEHLKVDDEGIFELDLRRPGSGVLGIESGVLTFFIAALIFGGIYLLSPSTLAVSGSSNIPYSDIISGVVILLSAIIVFKIRSKFFSDAPIIPLYTEVGPLKIGIYRSFLSRDGGTTSFTITGAITWLFHVAIMYALVSQNYQLVGLFGLSGIYWALSDIALAYIGHMYWPQIPRFSPCVTAVMPEEMLEDIHREPETIEHLFNKLADM